MGKGEFIENLVTQGKVPDYVTVGNVKRIFEIIELDLQHPNTPSCDSVIEVASGAPVRKAIHHLVTRSASEPSLYATLYKEYDSLE